MLTMENFLERLRQDPKLNVAVIITVDGDPARCVPGVQACGLTVQTVYTLQPMLTAHGPAESVLRLTAEPWVARIEPDAAVSI